MPAVQLGLEGLKVWRRNTLYLLWKKLGPFHPCSKMIVLDFSVAIMSDYWGLIKGGKSNLERYKYKMLLIPAFPKLMNLQRPSRNPHKATGARFAYRGQAQLEAG